MTGIEEDKKEKEEMQITTIYEMKFHQ